MFHQARRANPNEPLRFAAFMCIKLQLCFLQGWRPNEPSIHARLETAATAFGDGMLLEKMS